MWPRELEIGTWPVTTGPASLFLAVGDDQVDVIARRYPARGLQDRGDTGCEATARGEPPRPATPKHRR